MKKLSHGFVPVSDLYNDSAFPLNMYGSCFLILHTFFAKKHSYARRAASWFAVILQNFTESFMVESSVIILVSPNASVDDSKPVFENGFWLQKLSGRVCSLGSEVYGKGADYVFPVDYIASCLEGKSRGAAWFRFPSLLIPLAMVTQKNCNERIRRLLLWTQR